MEYDLYEICKKLLSDRGVEIEDIAELVMFAQKKYCEDLTIEKASEHVIRVLKKREVQNVILTGIELDVLVEKEMISKPLIDILKKDNPLYGVDEILVFSIVNIYGSIGFTNYGYLDKLKPGILKKLDEKKDGVCNVFLDDLVGAIAAAACSRIAHNTEGIKI